MHLIPLLTIAGLAALWLCSLILPEGTVPGAEGVQRAYLEAGAWITLALAEASARKAEYDKKRMKSKADRQKKNDLAAKRNERFKGDSRRRIQQQAAQRVRSAGAAAPGFNGPGGGGIG